jgi:D-glycero-D-manno-heptose 1,7-bisphosphate phosphatase
MNKAIFLDRDGIINKAIIKDDKAYSPRRFSEFEFNTRIAEQVEKIKSAGYFVIVVTNQPDITRGKMDIAELNKMTETIHSKLLVDEILICRHDDSDNCICRKPKPGMLFDAAKRYNIDLTASFLIGDGWRDMEAAKNAGCKGILIDAYYNNGVDCFKRVKDMNKAIDVILNNREEN